MEKLNGKNLYYMFLAGAKNLIDYQADVNMINVFPVADGDTGTNMASTIRMVVDNIEPVKSFKTTVDSIGEAALAGARGNSGIIFAQFLYGLSEEIEDCTEITIKEFSESLKRSVKYLYESVADPVEGTILTVIREWVEYIHDHNHLFDDFTKLMVNSYEAAKISLSETTHKLAVLAKANVVDAGAKGFVLFLEGMKEVIQGKDIRKVVELSRELSTDLVHDIPSEKPIVRYCTEAMLTGQQMDRPVLLELLKKFGDSVVVAGSSNRMRLHVHTNEPATLFTKLRAHGKIAFQKVEDMFRQFESAHKRKYKIALVTDSTCDLPEYIIEKYQINVVPINMVVNDNNYLDGLTLKADEFYRLQEEPSNLSSTSQPSPASFVNLYSQLVTYYDSVIAIHISGGLSGTYSTSLNAAKKVAAESGKKIDVIDSVSISGAVGLQVKRIAEMIDTGLSHDDIVRKSVKNTLNAKIFVSVRTLKYLVRSGRVSPVKGLIAQLLKIKPVISVLEDGKTVLLDKAITYKAHRRKVLSNIISTIGDRDIYGYSINHVSSPDEADYFVEQMKKITGKEPDFISSVSPALGVHTGKGTVAITFVTN